MRSITSRTEDHLHNVISHRSEVRSIDPQHNAGDVELLAQIGYKQELNRHYSTLQVLVLLSPSWVCYLVYLRYYQLG